MKDFAIECLDVIISEKFTEVSILDKFHCNFYDIHNFLEGK